MPDRYSLVRAVGARDPGAAGYILAALSLGSALGGLAGGKLRHRSRTSTQLMCLLVAMAGGIALAAVTPELLLAGVILALTGTVLAPSAVLSYLSAEHLAGPGAETSTWVNTAWNAGVAAGFALRPGGRPGRHDGAHAGGRGRAAGRGFRGPDAPGRLR